MWIQRVECISRLPKAEIFLYANRKISPLCIRSTSEVCPNPWGWWLALWRWIGEVSSGPGPEAFLILCKWFRFSESDCLIRNRRFVVVIYCIKARSFILVLPSLLVGLLGQSSLSRWTGSRAATGAQGVQMTKGSCQAHHSLWCFVLPLTELLLAFLCLALHLIPS